MTHYRVELACRACGSETLETVMDLGTTPLADRLVRPEHLDEADLEAPLTLAFCPACALVQIRETVCPEVLFGADYPYYSSVSESLMRHFADSANDIIARENLDARSLVVEAASNDGYLLRHFVDRGIPVLGIDPAPGPVAAAQARGVPSRLQFFGRDAAAALRAEHPHGADVFLANNVLAHVADLNGFVEGIRILLKESGTAVIEAPYVVDLVEHCEFDTIYHQHLCYFSVTALNALFRRHGLYLNDVERTWVHGGSLRLHVHPVEYRHERVDRLLAEERSRGVDGAAYFVAFAERVRSLSAELRCMLEHLKRSGHTIAGYGAAAKAATMLRFVGIDDSILDFVADQNRHKHGWHMGGNHLPIVGPEAILERMPDYVLLLAWNFAGEIMSAQREFARQGGKFIVPVPEPEIVVP